MIRSWFMLMLGRAWKFFLDTLFPIECVGCNKEGQWLCPQCAKEIVIEEDDVCFVCKKSAVAGKTCFACRNECALTAVTRFLNYDNYRVKTLLHTAKYKFIKDALTPLIRVCEPFIHSKLEYFDIDLRAFIIVPVPLHKRRLRSRGFNQAEIIGDYVATCIGARMEQVLTRPTARPPQAALNEFDRAVNISGNILCKRNAAVSGQYILLVDDVATSGATLDECAQVLRNSGARDVYGLVLAKG